MVRRTVGWAVGLGVAVGAALAYLLDSLVPAADEPELAVAAMIGMLAVSTPIVAVGLLLHEVRENGRRNGRLINIRPLIGGAPVPIGGWAMDADLGDLLVETINEVRPRLIVECGSGSSTVLAASMLRALGEGHLLSLEHDADFAERTRSRLRERGLDRWATVVTAPLEPREVDGETRRWYDIDLDEQLSGEIDLLVVDGPPRRSATLARYPAVPLLRHRMSERCVVILDDGNRPDERRISRMWSEMLGGRTTHRSEGKGVWIFEAG